MLVAFLKLRERYHKHKLRFVAAAIKHKEEPDPEKLGWFWGFVLPGLHRLSYDPGTGPRSSGHRSPDPPAKVLGPGSFVEGSGPTNTTTEINTHVNNVMDGLT